MVKEKWIVNGFSDNKKLFTKSFRDLSEAEHFWNKESMKPGVRVTLERG